MHGTGPASRPTCSPTGPAGAAAPVPDLPIRDLASWPFSGRDAAFETFAQAGCCGRGPCCDGRRHRRV